MRRWFALIVVFLLSSCAVGFQREFSQPTSRPVGKIVLGFEVPGGHGDLSIGGSLIRDSSSRQEKGSGMVLLTYQLMPYTSRTKRTGIPLLSPGFSLGLLRMGEGDDGDAVYLSGNLEANFFRFYPPPEYNFGHFYIAVRTYVLFPFRSRHTLPMGAGLEVGLRSSWWRAPW